MLTRGLRDRDAIALDLVGVAGLTALALGLTLLAPSAAIGFEPGRAVQGILSQLPVTLPAAVLLLVITAVDLGAGLTLARLVRGSPFTSITDAVLAAFAAAVLKDLALLAILGQVGLFRAPFLWTIDVALLIAAWRWRPLALGAWRPGLERVGSLPFALLIGVVWVGPVLLQLASPVVPFIDVLPNHVAPAEHLRTFGSFTPLTATQSPIYGASRTLLGYTALLGTLTTMSGLPAVLAVAAFILPSTVLVGLGAYRLVTAVAGPAAGPWALLVFALTGSFARLGDVRATVIVLPLVAWAFAFLAERLLAATAPGALEERPLGTAEERAPWRLADGVVLGLGLAAAVFVHPIIGALAVASVGLIAIVRPDRAGRIGIVAVVTAALGALPQLTTMVGIGLPASFAIAGVPLAILAGSALDRFRASHGPILRALSWSPVVIVPILILGASPLAIAVDLGPGPLIEAAELVLLAAVGGVILGARDARSPIIWAGVAVGVVVAIGTQLVPEQGTGLLGQALRFELPKTLYYWLPVFLAVAAAATLAWAWTTPSLPWLARVGGVGLFVVAAALPLRAEPIDILHLGEHRLSETIAIDLRYAGSGFWTGYPDSRRLVDPPRQALIDAVRAEIDAGRIGPDTTVLHVAESFQQWVATPLGVFAGVTETDVTPDAEHSIHTVGGRLMDFTDLPTLLASQTYRYLLYEPNAKLPAGVDQQIAAAGYRPIFSNEQGILYRLGGA